MFGYRKQSVFRPYFSKNRLLVKVSSPHQRHRQQVLPIPLPGGCNEKRLRREKQACRRHFPLLSCLVP
ncbi:hypothetical protein HMPREF1250_0216 [Megasphaera vaginalis (ex Srinivasan et al. 2021)]|uniref:Uncharacterized protein n=1 Tax=Megasphaera vaginalis (ex Srinivasan et al. 2021) TaxID=1111454 RepID=U7UN99_9FIRM|nr:hypothetical protein HMPREF1250_0216 [Megasphaera vaginalis (ex Srinivasan et al. 2021)]